jgi:hypothetical protein
MFLLLVVAVIIMAAVEIGAFISKQVRPATPVGANNDPHQDKRAINAIARHVLTV